MTKNDYCLLYDMASKRIKELEKENAGLKARLNAINLLTPELEKSSKLKTQQLTKAKEHIEKAVEIIKELGGIVREGVTCHYIVDYGALHRATLFLKEIAE